MRAPQLEGIEVTDRPGIGYQFTSLTMPGEVTIYDYALADGRGSTGQYEYRIQYRESATSSIYIRDCEVQKVNGPTDNISRAEAERLAEELVPAELPLDKISVCANSPPVSEIDLPQYAFVPQDTDLVIGVVDRISNSDNPVVEMNGGHLLLDTGDEDKLYLINRIDSRWGRVLCELPHPDEQTTLHDTAT